MKPAIYILTNFNRTTLYVGVTNNLARRLFEHKQKLLPGFSKQYNLTRLIYYEFFDRITDAIEREKAIKKKSCRGKEILIATINPTWRDLSTDL